MAQAAKKTAKLGSEGITWDLGDLYKGLDDPRIERDRKSLLKRAEKYERTYRGKINSKGITAKRLLEAVKELEAISEKTGKLLSFAYLTFAADTSKPEHGAFLQSAQEWATGLRKHLIFFELEWMEVPEKKARELLKSPALEKYKHFLELERRYKPHRLTEPEEKIMDEKSNTGSRAFKRLFDEVLNNIKFKVKIGKKTHDLSEKHDVDPYLVKAVIKAESNFDPGAVSPKNAQGIMQLIPATASDYGVDDPFDAKENMEGGVEYLSDLLNYFEGDLRLSLAAYNAGKGAVIKHGFTIPPYPETTEYISRVLGYYKILKSGKYASKNSLAFKK